MEPMQGEQPTGDGASITERLESFLAAEEETSEPTDQPETAEAAEEPGEPAEEPAEEAEQEAASDGGEEGEEPQIALDDVASFLGVDAERLDTDEAGNLLIKTKIDGEEGAAKFEDFLASYQIRGHIDNQSREVAEQKKALQAQAEESRQAVETKLQEVETLAQHATAELVREFEAIDWQGLRESQPAEYAALQTDFQQKQARINDVILATQQERATQQAKQAEQTQARLTEEAQKIATNIPGWDNEATAKAERAEIRAWASKQLEKWGEDPNTINQVDRGFHVEVLRKAMLYDKLQQSKAVVEKKVRKAPKIVKSGQPPSKADQNERHKEELKQRIKKSGGKEGVVEYLISQGKV